MNNIYLISSTSYYLLKEEIENILNNNIYIEYDLNFNTIEDVVEEANYFSIFEEKKYIVVKNANCFSSTKTKLNTDLLLKYLEEPNPNTIILFTLNSNVDGKKKICKIIKDKYKLIKIDNLSPKEIYNKLDKKIKEDKYKIEYQDLYYIINNSQNNYDIAYNEIEKIKLYYNKPSLITREDINNIISNNIEDNNFKLIDSIMKKDIKSSFKIYEDLILKKIEPIILLIMLSKEIRNTLLVKLLVRNNNDLDIMKMLNINYDFQYNKILNNSYSYSKEELENYLVTISDLDYKIKSGKISSKHALELLILEIFK